MTHAHPGGPANRSTRYLCGYAGTVVSPHSHRPVSPGPSQRRHASSCPRDPSFLLLLLELVPSDGLLYLLEQAHDHYEADTVKFDMPTSPLVPDSSCAPRTPPTPSLLQIVDPVQLLSRTHLRLVTSIFPQMCEAVARVHLPRELRLPPRHQARELRMWVSRTAGARLPVGSLSVRSWSSSPTSHVRCLWGLRVTEAAGRGSSGENALPALTLQANSRQNHSRRPESPTRRQKTEPEPEPEPQPSTARRSAHLALEETCMRRAIQ